MPKEGRLAGNACRSLRGKDVEETYFGEKGIIANSEDNAILIDMTTSSPKLAAKIYDEAKAVGKHALDAPVSGGDSGAKEGRLAGNACRSLRGKDVIEHERTQEDINNAGRE